MKVTSQRCVSHNTSCAHSQDRRRGEGKEEQSKNKQIKHRTSTYDINAPRWRLIRHLLVDPLLLFHLDLRSHLFVFVFVPRPALPELQHLPVHPSAIQFKPFPPNQPQEEEKKKNITHSNLEKYPLPFPSTLRSPTAKSSFATHHVPTWRRQSREKSSRSEIDRDVSPAEAVWGDVRVQVC